MDQTGADACLVAGDKYGDDDLDAGSINPHQLFFVFNELVQVELNPLDGCNPAYMIDKSHNVTDPIESMLSSAEAITSAPPPAPTPCPPSRSPIDICS